MTKLNLDELEALWKEGHERGLLNMEINDYSLPVLTNSIPQLIARIREQDKTIAMLRRALGEKAVVTLYEGKEDKR